MTVLSQLKLIAITGVALGAMTLGAAAQDQRALGDDRLGRSPQRGYLMSCQGANPNAPGAQVEGPWISGDAVLLDQMIFVQGAVEWPGGWLDIDTSATGRRLQGNNLPSHATGVYPVQRTDLAYQYDRNPNRIRAQRIALDLPLAPQIAAQASCVPMGMIGVTLNNVVLFNAVDARGDDAAAHEMLDACHGHPERRGAYHYHDLSPCLSDARDASGHSVLVGYAIDGFGLYGPYDGTGEAQITNAALDDCHGHVGPVLWDGARVEMYHYHLNAEFPFSVGCLRGTPVATQ